MTFIRSLINRIRGEADISKLQKMGLKIGSNFSYGSNCFFDPSHCFLITIGNDVTFSTRVHVLAHDASTKKLVGYTKIGRVNIGDHVFIGANVTVLPGVSIGDNAVIGAGAIVTTDVEADSVYAGVPARKLCTIAQYQEKLKDISQDLYFGEEWTVRGGITDSMKNEMYQMLDGGKIGLIK